MAAAQKNSEKNSAGPVRDGRGRLRGGNPGNRGGRKGRSGRKPLRFRTFSRDVLNDLDTQNEIRDAAADRSTHGYSALIRTLATVAGYLNQTVSVKGGAGKRRLTFTLAIGADGGDDDDE